MKLSESVKPISFFKSHASEIVRNLSRHPQTLLVTHRGEAKAVLQDIHTYEQTQNTLAILKILALSRENIRKGNVTPIHAVWKKIAQRIQPPVS